MKILLKSFIIAIPFFITACISLEQDVILYPDGSGKMHIDYWMLLPDEESRSVADKIGIFNPDSVRGEFQSKYTEISNIEIYSDSTDSTTHAIVDLTFGRIDSLNLTRAFSYSDFSFKEGGSGQITLTQFIPPIATGFGINASDYNVTYKYKISGSILFHNAHIFENNILTWNYSLDEIGGGKTITVIFRPFKLKETPDWIYMLTGSVLALVIFFLFKKKKD